VPRAFDRDLALRMQRVIWDELREDFGIDRCDRATWRVPPRSPLRAKRHALNDELAGERFQAVISDLLGYDTWPRPATWGGFLVTFPEPSGTRWDVPSDTWHWDGSPDSQGLLIFSFYSEVRHAGGGTLLLDGSHRLISDFYASLSPEQLRAAHKLHRKMLERWDPWLESLTMPTREPDPDRAAKLRRPGAEVRGVPCHVVELTGEPGDAVFCNLKTLHSAATNTSDVPRVMRSKFLFLDEPPSNT